MLASRTAPASLDDYRITARAEILALLEQVQRQRALLTLSSPDGNSYTTLLYGIDAKLGLISFSADGKNESMQMLLASDEIVAVVYLDRVKIQFDIDGLLHVRGSSEALNARFPDVAYRFQRRSAFRVQPFASHGPSAQFRHPAMPDMRLSLRVLDVSLTGIALFLPEDVPIIAPGVRIGQCEVRLDSDTLLDVGLIIHHVTCLHPDTHGARLGGELVHQLGNDRSLQHYVHQTQKRRSALSV
jgi:c-di-GMP-binding flagellar brake protein YcgR